MESPIPAANLVGFKSATKAALSRLHLSADFPGCYVLLDGDKPLYVSISRSVIQRLIQHLNHGSHYAASLVYRMASVEYPHEMRRDQAMRDEKFKAVFLSTQERLRRTRIAFICPKTRSPAMSPIKGQPNPPKHRKWPRQSKGPPGRKGRCERGASSQPLPTPVTPLRDAARAERTCGS